MSSFTVYTITKPLFLVIFLILSTWDSAVSAQCAQGHKFKYSQHYYNRPRKYTDKYAILNQFRFTVRIKGDFSTFDKDTELGLIIGEMDIFQTLGDETSEYGFRTIDEALELANTGYVQGKVDDEKGKGSLTITPIVPCLVNFRALFSKFSRT